MRSHNAGLRDRRLRLRRLPLAVVLAAIIGTSAWAEPGFPTKPIRISIPFGAGGVADLTMRLLAQGLTERTKQQVIIENRPGAGGLMSARAVLDAPPDGYTLGVIGNGQAIAMSLFKARPYNVLTDFTFVSITARFEMLLAVKAESPLKSLQDVVTAARNPAGDREDLPHALGADVPAVEIAPAVHPEILSTTSSSGAETSSRPCSRIVACVRSTRTVQPAPRRAA